MKLKVLKSLKYILSGIKIVFFLKIVYYFKRS